MLRKSLPASLDQLRSFLRLGGPRKDDEGPASERWVALPALLCALCLVLVVGFVTLVRAPTPAEPEAVTGGRVAAGDPSLPAAERFGAGVYVPEEVLRANLTAALHGLASADTEFERRSLFDSVRAYGDQLTPHLLPILSAESRMLAPAISICGGLKLKNARPELERLARLRDSRASAEALRAAEAIEPWTTTDLASFLDAQEPRVVEAALQILAERDERPVGTPLGTIVELLGHPTWYVRKAASEAIPGLPRDHPAKSALRTMARGKNAPAAEAAVRAVARGGLDDASEDCLATLVHPATDWRVRTAAIEVLSQKTSPLRNPLALMAVAGEPSCGIEERAQVFRAWELTRAIPVREIHALLPDLPPLLRLYAARCLIVAGDERAIGTLVGLLALQPAEDAGARDGAHAVLVEIAGRDLGWSAEAWQRWGRAVGTLEAGRLQCAPPRGW